MSPTMKFGIPDPEMPDEDDDYTPEPLRIIGVEAPTLKGVADLDLALGRGRYRAVLQLSRPLTFYERRLLPSDWLADGDLLTVNIDYLTLPGNIQSVVEIVARLREDGLLLRQRHLDDLRKRRHAAVTVRDWLL